MGTYLVDEHRLCLAPSIRKKACRTTGMGRRVQRALVQVVLPGELQGHFDEESGIEIPGRRA